MGILCIFSSDNMVEIENVKNILEENNIPVMIKNLYTQNIFGGVKPFSGHDAIAGSIEVYVNEDEIEKGLKLLEKNIIGEDINEDIDNVEDYTDYSIQNGKAKECLNNDIINDRLLKRSIYFSLIMSSLSFLIIPYFINLFLIRNILKQRKIIGIMLIILSNILFLSIWFIMILSKYNIA